LPEAHLAGLIRSVESVSRAKHLVYLRDNQEETIRLMVAPIVILGWFSQKHLVRGLTFGAVK